MRGHHNSYFCSRYDLYCVYIVCGYTYCVLYAIVVVFAVVRVLHVFVYICSLHVCLCTSTKERLWLSTVIVNQIKSH